MIKALQDLFKSLEIKKASDATGWEIGGKVTRLQLIWFFVTFLTTSLAIITTTGFATYKFHEQIIKKKQEEAVREQIPELPRLRDSLTETDRELALARGRIISLENSVSNLEKKSLGNLERAQDAETKLTRVEEENRLLRLEKEDSAGRLTQERNNRKKLVDQEIQEIKVAYDVKMKAIKAGLEEDFASQRNAIQASSNLGADPTAGEFQIATKERRSYKITQYKPFRRYGDRKLMVLKNLNHGAIWLGSPDREISISLAEEETYKYCEGYRDNCKCTMTLIQVFEKDGTALIEHECT